MMNGFDENEHRRLAADFRNLNCQALMIIGKTRLTEELYAPYIPRGVSKEICCEHPKSLSIKCSSHYCTEL